MRVLVLTAATGGGHDMRAEAFKLWSDERADWRTGIHRPLEGGHPFYRFGVGLYNSIQRTWPALHHGYFHFLELARMHRYPGLVLGARRYVDAVRAFGPDVVLSTHAHLNHAYFELARRALGRDNVRCVTYCGELGGGYGFSRHWVNPDADLFIGAVRETLEAAAGLGMRRSKCWLGGFLLKPGFYEVPRTEADRSRFVEQALELDPDRCIVLLATGAVGANNHLAILQALERRGKPIQVVALCGRDEKTFAAVDAWGRETACTARVRALKHWGPMPLLLASVSLVVARPGSGLSSEAMLLGTPLIWNGIGGIMPQESLTVRFGRRYGFADVIRRPGQVGEILDRWEREPDARGTMYQRLGDELPRTTPRDILDKIGNI